MGLLGWAFAFGEGRNPRAFCFTGVAVGFLIAATNRVVLFSAHAVGLHRFFAVFGGFAGGRQCGGQEQEEDCFFHGYSKS